MLRIVYLNLCRQFVVCYNEQISRQTSLNEWERVLVDKTEPFAN
jgi:hypothetical protein